MITPYYKDADVIIYCGNSQEILPSLAGQYDFLLSDPPYGINYDTTEKKHGHDLNFKPIAADATNFDARHLVALDVPSILWGGNCFASCLPDWPGWLTWVKTAASALASPERGGVRLRKADTEMAWTNFLGRSQAYIMPWIGVAFDSEDGRRGNDDHHPTCKPVELMTWCLNLAPKKCSTVLDPYMGGGSTLVAASCIEGWKGIGIELEERYCEMAVRRFRNCTQKNKKTRGFDGEVPLSDAAVKKLKDKAAYPEEMFG